ncbi:subclass B1 metallo-beta-lactamase [Spirosoma utsteinense]|uniref:beta-lactamase n=1 Tax=Spirosoma utsteinense TaxID=2585773 RepID=A0ABR6W9X3_9BACT|nr:subclass B1 metallo-beta-lactamase [Spirosoma utsteinense]MBC3788244.1 metallo-beta-lactamase class B [Spirosoma utsteinense]MBC3793365.1 metallo-beta-lactamase class B [Spirosoma utsteinense]
MRILLTILMGLLLASRMQAQTVPTPPISVTPISDRVFVHITYGMYGGKPYPSNGLIIDTKDGVVLVDTGWDSDTSTDNTRQVLQWVSTNLHKPVRLCIVTHAHDDRVAGISELRKAGVRVISTPATARKSVERGFQSPDAILPGDTTFSIGQESIRCFFPGEGHTSDNIVVWLPKHQVLFGGCLVKSVAVFGMGNLADANVNAWAGSIRKLMSQFGTARVVVPGHEDVSDAKALEHTLQLVTKYTAAKK